MTTLKLSEYEVDVTESLTWGQYEKLNSFEGIKIQAGSGELPEVDASYLLERKYKTIESAIVEIRKGDKKISFTREWLNNLSIDDGDEVLKACEKATSKKKE